MDGLDKKLLEDLKKDGRMSYAQLGRKYNVSRVCIRDRVNGLLEEGIIERFTIQINPEKLGKKLAVFFDIEVKPCSLYNTAEELAAEGPVTDVFIMTGAATLYVNALLKNRLELEEFLRDKIYTRQDILNVKSEILLRRFRNDKGGIST